MTCFRTCSTRRSRSQAPLCHYTRRLVSNQAEGTFARLRYYLGGDRPSQTAHQTVSPTPDHGVQVRFPDLSGWYFKVGSTETGVPSFKASHLSYANKPESQCQVAVKVHGVFPSCRG